MSPGARTPEELETLFEDAFVLRDQAALAEVFERGAVLLPGGGLREARGRDEIAGVARDMWSGQRVQVADPQRVLQVRGTALILAASTVSVARRGSDGAWRYVISVLGVEKAASDTSMDTRRHHGRRHP